jgi:hypothetical protein
MEASMNHQRVPHQIIILAIGLLLTAGCTAISPSTPTIVPPTVTPLPPTATLIPPTATPEEKYEELDPSDLYIEIEGSIQNLEVDAAGGVISIKGVVDRMAVGDKPIELSSNEISLEGTDAFIATKNFGKIKITFDSLGSATLWLKPSQKEMIKELLK